jgi:hypothetical protein
MRNLNLFNMALRSPVAEKFLAFSAEKTADDGNRVIALLEVRWS